MPTKPDIIVLAINQKFFNHLKALLGSIFTNWPNSPNILIYTHPDLTEESLMYLANFKKITVIKYNPEKLKYHQLIQQNKSYFKSKEFIDTGFFSLHLFSEDFQAYRNLLFLDADTLVLQPLDELLDSNKFFICSAFNSKLLPYFNVNQSQPQKTLLLSYWLFKLLQFKIIPKPFISANSGVMLIPENLRGNKTERDLLKILNCFQSVCSSDQEIILLFAMKHKLSISNDFRYNFQLRFLNLIKQSTKKYTHLTQAAKDIKVIHFNGPKPNSAEFETHSWTEGQDNWKALYHHYIDALNKLIA